MHYSKRFIAFGGIVAIAFLIKYNIPGAEYEQIGSFRGASLEAETWNPLIASSVNDNLLSVIIDNKQYTNEKYKFYMDDNLDIMMPVSILRDALNCSAHIYDGDRLVVEKHSSDISFSLDQETATVNGDIEKITSPFTMIDNEYYVSLNDLSQYMDYTYSWNMQENEAQAADNSDASIVPTSYDLRTKNRTSEVRNQGSYGTCWSFAALGALESSLLPEESEQYSVDHMTLCNGFNMTQNDGGEYTMGMAYLAAWKGPVYEKDDPYGDNQTNEDLTAVKHVQEMQIIESKDYEKIKEAVFKYGGVQTSIYNALRSSQSSSPYYNKSTDAYCYIGTEKPNHDVVIVGWDDSYSKDNFNTDLEGDGAFICQNSWGDNFGENGFFYISYYDTNIGTHNVVYTDIENTDNYDHIYQSDLCGWVGQLGYGNEEAYFANLYTANGDEVLEAVGFYATAPDTSYEVYVVNKVTGEADLTFQKKAASGSFSNAGYYTVKLDKPVLLSDGDRYAVIVYVRTPGSERPVAVEYTSKDGAVIANLSGNEGYISMKGTSWQSAQDKYKCNICFEGIHKRTVRKIREKTPEKNIIRNHK